MDISTELDRVKAFVEKSNYHAAINIAISALNECRRNNNQAGVDFFLQVIRDVVQSMTDEFGHQE